MFAVITATGYMPNGVYEGGFANLGSQDQCLKVESNKGIRGRYCTLFWRPPTEVSLAAFTKEELRENPRLDIRLWLNNTRERFHVGSRSGVCIPSTCQQKEMNHIISGVASAYGAEASLKYCRTKEAVRFKKLEVGIMTTIPAMVVVLAFFLLPKLVHGPLAEEHLSKYYNGCSKNWWTVLVHINNFNKYEEICLDHYWYISVDMQIFVVASVLCVLMTRCLLWALALCCTTVVVFASWPWNNMKLPSRGVAALYSALHKNAWALSLGWITYACATGQAGKARLKSP
ncbi:hypothetical protein HPB51_008421 [Rhipicephalus microplus]|uniref:Nose resistant-to-fluoxetine protein N-terminal domain-containing protein n=1 Tax=Rhipicephalus microplus TaxID=6941 RepID=A0A9J6EFG9_RHIMP|nr:hypothetical protein HPB51_008421 [Rhipicephalus microplus]